MLIRFVVVWFRKLCCVGLIGIGFLKLLLDWFIFYVFLELEIILINCRNLLLIVIKVRGNLLI